MNRSKVGAKVIAIVGRPNVGKSTLFNRLIGARKAIVHDRPGVTRDRHYGRVLIEGIPFVLVDTGGFEPDAESSLKVKMRAQVNLAVEEADLVLFVMDAREGITPQDRDVAGMLRRSGKAILYIANKVDDTSKVHLTFDFYELGMERVLAVSAEHGVGIRELKGAILETLAHENDYAMDAAHFEELSDHDAISVAVIGFPNVGKSTLINRVLGEERLVAHDEPGTTVDPVDSEFVFRGQKFNFIDTAGVRRRSKVRGATEKISAIKALKSLERADVAVLLLDVTRGVADQEARLAYHAVDAGCGLVLGLNKVDTVKVDSSGRNNELDAAAALVREKLRFVDYAPLVRISGRTGKGTTKLLQKISMVAGERKKRVTTGELNRFFEKVVQWHDPPLYRRRPIKLYYIAQVGTEPPTFALVCNKPQGLPEQYKRYLINSLREYYGFNGTPIRLKAKPRSRR